MSSGGLICTIPLWPNSGWRNRWAGRIFRKFVFSIIRCSPMHGGRNSPNRRELRHCAVWLPKRGPPSFFGKLRLGWMCQWRGFIRRMICCCGLRPNKKIVFLIWMFGFGAYLTASKERSCPSSARARFPRVGSIWVLPKKGQSPANSSHEVEPRTSGGLDMSDNTKSTTKLSHIRAL